ncbi:MAG: lactate utilization protein [Oscillospiraceae bacterium]|nr:lactate utilization protein [Oscillospiraceae bacterium]
MSDVRKTIRALASRNFETYYCEYAVDALRMVKELIPAGSTVSTGGSMTLQETGIIDMLRAGDYDFRPHGVKWITKEEDLANMQFAFSCDYYLMSSNAITEDGELYNIDGVGNRVAALSYGPKHVIIVAGVNKIVKDLDAARERLTKTAVTRNLERLGLEAPCINKGRCFDCRSEGRLCATKTVTAYTRFPGRIKIIIVNEELGF